MSKLQHSHSTLKDYATCPHKFFRTKIAKDVVVTYGSKQNWGQQVHDALEFALKHGAPMPSNMVQYQSVVDRFGPFRPHILSEKYLGMTRDGAPTTYKTGWLRAIIDTLVVVPESPVAIMTDFKTGKRWLDWQQHDIGALLVFANYPGVETIKASYMWLSSDEPDDKKVYYREDLATLRSTLIPLTERVEWSHGSNIYPKKAGPLCAWCPVQDCEFWKERPEK